MIVWSLDLQLPMQSVPITTDVVGSTPARVEVYNIVIKFVSDLRQVDRWFSLSPQVFSTNKTDRHDKIEILSKVALNIINLNLVNILVNSSRIQESKRSSMCVIWRGVDVASVSWVFLLEFGTDSTALYMICFSFHHHYKMIFLSAYYHQLLTLVQST